MNIIIINSSHNFNKSNKFIYNLPTNCKFTKNDTIGVSSLNIYNSFFNIESSRNNNKFSIIWNANTSIQYDFIIPDGFYSISDLNYMIQFFCAEKNLYYFDSVLNKNVYYIELAVNAQIYGCELRLFTLPITSNLTDLNLSLPVGATWNNDTLEQTPQVIFDDGFGSLFGFVGGTYPLTPLTINKVIASTNSPEIQLVNSIICTCNLINSNYANPCNVLYSCPLNASYGNLITGNSSTRIDSNIFDGYYRSIVLELYDQNFDKLNLHDFEVEIKLCLIVKET